jgi:hypothetical protein
MRIAHQNGAIEAGQMLVEPAGTVGQRVDAHAHRGGRGTPLCGRRRIIGKLQTHVRTGVLPADGGFRQMLAQGAEQRVAAQAVHLPQTLEMAVVAAFTQELHQRGLFEPWQAVVHQGFDRHRRLDKLTWHHGVTDAHARANRAREGIEVDHAAVAVERLQ